jgi:hypothetical protein
MACASLEDDFRPIRPFGIRNEIRASMTLKSALQDLRETTLAAVSGLLGKLSYLGSLRREGGYLHWGMSLVHGEESSERAWKAAHTEVLSAVLRTPISKLVEDLHESVQDSPKTAAAYVEGMREQFGDLLPSPPDSVSARHLSSVLVALSSLEKKSELNRKRATP